MSGFFGKDSIPGKDFDLKYLFERYLNLSFNTKIKVDDLISKHEITEKIKWLKDRLSRTNNKLLHLKKYFSNEKAEKIITSLVKSAQKEYEKVKGDHRKIALVWEETSSLKNKILSENITEMLKEKSDSIDKKRDFAEGKWESAKKWEVDIMNKLFVSE